MAQSVVEYNGATFHISYEVLNPAKEKSIVFLHGWGSNKELMKSSFSKNLKDYRHIYIDLPGFGQSDNSLVLSSFDYAKIIKEFLDKSEFSYEIVLGHSFGGKVATLLNPKKLILVASAGILLPKSLHVKLKIALSKVLNLFGLKALKRFFVADDAKSLSQNMYETFKVVIAEDFKEIFERREEGALLLWGEQDSATPLISAKLMNGYIKDSKLVVFEGDHYFFMKNAPNIESEILLYVK